MSVSSAQSLSKSETGVPSGVPVHVAIIMDGNGRWAKSHGLPRTAGHKRGAEAVKRVVEGAGKFGIKYLTLFGFSSENWSRPESEIRDLLNLLRHTLKNDVTELHKQGIRLRVIGERMRLPVDTVELINNAETLTASNTKLMLTIALSYGGRQEIVAAAKSLAADCIAGHCAPSDIDEHMFGRRLFTADTPDPDILIRTSGEQRISNFLLWQIAYTELVFTETLWPDFDRTELEAAISDFSKRDRRYGAVKG